jgi:hypothetical protein
MSKSWKAPFDGQSIPRLGVAQGGAVRTGSVIAELRVDALPTDFPANAVNAPIDGHVLYYPGQRVGSKPSVGARVFTVFSPAEWAAIPETLGPEMTAKLLAWPETPLTYDEFSEQIDRLTRAGIERLMGLSR